MSKLIEIFKAGKHTALSGATLTFSESDLKAAVAAYDPAVYEAPLVVGHPKLDAPAYGWVKSIDFADDGKMLAEPHQVDTEFSEIVQAGRFKKVSAAFFAPDAPNNPKPGVWYLKHVGFLGAQAPAVKGLKSVQFAESEQGVFEFADWDKMTIANLFRRVREYVIGKDGLEFANNHFPEYEINSLTLNAAQEDEHKGGMRPYFAEPNNQGDDMTPEQKAEMEALKAQVTTLTDQNKTLSTQVASFAEAQTKARHDEHVSFAEGLVQAGKLLPADKDGAVAMLDKLAQDETTVQFGEGDGKQTMTPLAMYKAQLEKAPVAVHFGEHGAGDADDAGTVAFAAPQGMTVSADKLDIHNKALKYAQEHKVDYLDAVKKVS